MRLIKKYKNRRLYDTELKKTIKIEDIKRYIDDGIQIKVIDNATNKDITVKTMVLVLSSSAKDTKEKSDNVIVQLLLRKGVDVMDVVKKLMLAAIGAVNLSKERVEEILDELVKKGEMTSGEKAEALRKMADKMIEGASVAGFPFLLHTTEYYKNLRAIVGKLRESGFNNYANRVFYDAFHSLTFGVEVNHYVLSPEETAQSGLSVIQALLEMGLQTFPWEYYPGYPNRIICGDFLASIRPYGKTSSERRASRKELWLNRHNFEQPYNPYRKMLDKNSVDIIFKYSGESSWMHKLCVGLILPHSYLRVLSINSPIITSGSTKSAPI